ncbi:MAG: B12-binding domain-containing radical SAM protein [Desulfomonile sp.]|nr:B12-binding domain-containing radical SAM protein [Desulfomonile sp.]
MSCVLFVQLPPPRFSFQEPPSNIPLAAGFLAAALKGGEKDKVVPEVAGPDIVDVYADRGLAAKIAARRPDVLALTLYVWNAQRSLFLASAVKRHSPAIKVLVGGPEVTPDNMWVLRHPAVDAGVFGEGESRIVAVVEALAAGKDPRGIPGIFFKTDARIETNMGPAPRWDLDRCPYPYLDRTIAPSRDGTLFLETVRGCPFRCRYCYYHKTYELVRSYSAGSIDAVLDFAYGSDSAVRELYLMDPTFNFAKGFRDVLRSMAARRSSKDLAVHTELRADLLDSRDVGLLCDAGLKTAEVGLQTIDKTVLAAAGRQGDPIAVAAGVTLLKNSGVEVTTGIILGLPGDTPEGFSRTLQWLKRTGAYSVVHPFVLSVLPGTDFRAQAGQLGLTYDSRPPYYVQSTPSFPRDAFMAALVEYEETYDVELDAIPRPSLVDRGPVVAGNPGGASYISKWIIDPSRRGVWSKVLAQVLDRATDPFIMWFRGACSENAVIEVLSAFVEANPHAVLSLVFETTPPPRPPFLERALEAAGDPGVFVNRSYAPLSGDAEVITPDFTILLPDPGDPGMRVVVADAYASMATVVWERTEFGSWADVEPPILISCAPPETEYELGAILAQLERIASHRPEDILFRDPDLLAAWKRRTGKIDIAALWPESILVTA